MIKEMSEKIKTWQTNRVKPAVAVFLFTDGVNFNYTREDGIVFSATTFYVNVMRRKLKMYFGKQFDPQIYEVK